jgi:hypothetical protein
MVIGVDMQEATHQKEGLRKTAVDVKGAQGSPELNLLEIGRKYNFESGKGILLKQIPLIIGYYSP